jgi:hypothetical protein
MAEEAAPIKPLLSCPKCGLEMRVLGIESENAKRDIYTFECDRCDTLEVRGVRVL